jgi:cysteinyl-tRNA synthetase
MALSLYNTLGRGLQVFQPADSRQITFYSCGPTVYDDAHIGNFRSFLAADTLRNYLESPLCRLDGSPLPSDLSLLTTPARRVTHVMNITDVGHMTDDEAADGGGEDKMAAAGRRLLEAKKAGKLPADSTLDPSDPRAIARFYTDRFLEDARALGLKVAIESKDDPSLMPRASAFVPGMIVVIQRLIERGHAYVVGQPGERVVYFSVSSFAGYGTLSGNRLEDLREGEGGRINASNQQTKRHPADFLLWKEDPRHIMKWPSPWGTGYPGWHIECSAMSAWRLWLGEQNTPEGTWSGDGSSLRGLEGWLRLFNQTASQNQSLIDLHSGGEDNAFPHHECELAQSACAFNQQAHQAPFAKVWFHVRHLFVEGQKMSKSKGNFFTARDLFAKGIEPGALRLELIRAHYRTNANFTQQGLEDSARMMDRFAHIASTSTPAGHDAPDRHTKARAMLQQFAEAMDDDLNVAKALGSVNAWMNTIGTPTIVEGQAIKAVDAVLGVVERPRLAKAATAIAVYAAGVTPSEEIERLLLARKEARARKDFAASDAARDQLKAMGLAIKDLAGNQVEVRRGS